MRLLHSGTLQLEEFFEDKIPFYAILSHTWEEGEVSFQDMQSRDAEKKPGYDKIKHCCAIAAADGFEYVWVDTCCIDKTSSAELSEAINSMHRWYQKAEVCYAYLADVPPGDDACAVGSKFATSRWFTRGWTLQELLAPASVLFFDRNWGEIGTKSSLEHVITKATRIHAEALLGDESKIHAFSVAQRISWAAERRTSRTEDMAYCLLGLLNTNMPMLYGEGKRAFIRLQEEILRTSDDPTIFAWGYVSGNDDDDEDEDDFDYDDEDTSCISGMLAESPKGFRFSGNIVRSRGPDTMSFTLTNKGIHIQLRAKLSDEPGLMLAVLDCHETNDLEHRYTISLQINNKSGYSFRYHTGTFTAVTKSVAKRFKKHSTFIKQEPSSSWRPSFAPYSRYRIRADNIQDWYPSTLTLSDGSLAGATDFLGKAIVAVKLGIHGKSSVIVLNTPLYGPLRANIVQSARMRVYWRLFNRSTEVRELGYADLIGQCKKWLPERVFQSISESKSCLEKNVDSGYSIYRAIIV